ncbi:protein serine/threonine phosphatase 2C [Dacryopinax primogenitus]|uniref:Protein serine/threonine phosphatase 2C n=1 Tax=Dacryopinax primogenitus (strain DJM 731) TaxID=1858805 RepID=M5G5I7_DACPD|nr:protein serine/threonine phosphatase 2C [Dacryopinax primogenitus]EJU03959.1 protein serine/threonine phosphatase 2C [Dacryopinax primogenitus]
MHILPDERLRRSPPSATRVTHHKKHDRHPSRDNISKKDSQKFRPCKLNIDEINSMSEQREHQKPHFLDESTNARSKSITIADGPFTHGMLNQLPAMSEAGHPFLVGVSEDRGQRRTMEDAHSFVVDFAGVRGQGYFAIFDGHAGKHAAEWCGAHFHEVLLDSLAKHPDTPIPDLLNLTFQNVDRELSRIAESGKTHSGCTAVTTFLRLEDAKKGGQALSHKAVEALAGGAVDDAVTKLADKARHGPDVQETVELGSARRTRKVLYTANAGDARAVLCRDGKAIRLTYDHKGSDHMEAKRITDAGGFVMNNRVNGVLAVTRSLGDSAMKEFVVGSPYTTETELGEEDEFIIIACDGLWDVVEDQAAVELVRHVQDPQKASEILKQHALDNFSTDNISVLVVRFYHDRNT